jgi:uncharacterized protein (TIGR00251 family)
MIDVRDTSGGAAFNVKVQPRARRNALAREVGGVLKLSLTAPPVEGRANEACVEFLAELLQVPRGSFTIASGQTSRKKTIRVSGVTAGQVRARLGV